MDQTTEPVLKDPAVNFNTAPPGWAKTNRDLGQEQQDTANAQATGFGETVKRSFLYGDNYAVQIAKDIMRKGEYGGKDASFDPEKYIEMNKDRIDAPQQWRFLLSGNKNEADALLADSETQKREQDILEKRGGFSTFVARGLTGLVDVDAPLALLSGGLSAEAKLGLNATRMGRMSSGAISGALTQTAAAEVGYLASPTEDWTSVPVAGLAGALLGTVGATLSRDKPSLHTHEEVSVPANEARDRLLNSYGESLNDGAVLAKQDIRTESHASGDFYRSAENRSATLAQDGEVEGVQYHSLPDEPSAAGGASEAIAKPKVFKLPPQGEDAAGFGGASAGAAQSPASRLQGAPVTSNRSAQIISDARQWAKDTSIPDKWDTNEGKLAEGGTADGFLSDTASTAIDKAARRFHDIVTSTGLVTDFGRMMRTGSAVAQKLATDIFENSSGIIRNNRSASALMDHYEKQLRSVLIPLDDNFKEWSQRVHGAGVWDRITDTNLRKQFNEDLVTELQARRYDAPGSRSVDPAIVRAADEWDKWSAKDIEISQGRAGEGTRRGYEDLTPSSGYMPQKWDGRKIQDVITRMGKDAVVNAVTEGYRIMHPNVAASDLKIWAKAVIDRAVRQDQGVSSNLIGVLQSDGRAALEDALRRNGVPDADINRLIDGLTHSMDKKNAPGHTKQRVDIDLRYRAGNGIRIMDLMETDMIRIASMRSRQTAGASALARKGIESKADWEAIKQAILDEQASKGQTPKTAGNLAEKLKDAVYSDKHITAEELDHMYSYFGSGPVAGGTSPLVSRMKKLTNLATLNQLGLAQFAEFGPMVATVGWKRFTEIAGAEIMDALRNKNSPLVKELKHMNVLVPEERLFRDDLTFEHERYNGSAGELSQKFDNMLNKGQRIQGYTSGFYTMRNIQQRIAVTSAADRIMRALKNDLKTITPERLYDIGFDKDNIRNITSYVKDGTVEFKDGNLYKLNLDKWNPYDAENFILTLNRQTNQLVQKAMAGESSILFHKDGVAALFFHLKAFPMQAMEKQALRTLRIADQEGQMAFLYGLATAGAAYTIKNVLNNRDDNLSASKIASGAFNMSNMTGWIPMWIDPLAGMLGMDSLKFNHYASGRGQAPIFSAPASYDVLNRMLAVPGAAQHALRGDLSTADVRAFQTIPLIGNAVGFTTMFNGLKDYAKENQKALAKEAREKKKANEALGTMPGVPFLN